MIAYGDQTTAAGSSAAVAPPPEAPFPSFTPFSPSHEQAGIVLACFVSGRQSLAEVAAANNTTLPALALWLETPEALDRAAAFTSGLAAVARLGAVSQLGQASRALCHIVDEFNARKAAGATAAAPVQPGAADAPKPPTSLTDIRERRLILAAACLIFRIARTPDRIRPSAARAAPAFGASFSDPAYPQHPAQQPAHQGSSYRADRYALSGFDPVPRDSHFAPAHHARPAHAPAANAPASPLPMSPPQSIHAVRDYPEPEPAEPDDAAPEHDEHEPDPLDESGFDLPPLSEYAEKIYARLAPDLPPHAAAGLYETLAAATEADLLAMATKMNEHLRQTMRQSQRGPQPSSAPALAHLAAGPAP